MTVLIILGFIYSILGLHYYRNIDSLAQLYRQDTYRLCNIIIFLCWELFYLLMLFSNDNYRYSNT